MTPAAVTVSERLGGGASPFGEGDQCRAAVGGMRFAGHEPGGHQAVDQGGDGTGRDMQIAGQRGLDTWSALLKLPQDVRPRLGQALAGKAVGHVPAEQHRQLKDPVESRLPPLTAHMVTLAHNDMY